jgi:hypothetical protein
MTDSPLMRVNSTLSFDHFKDKPDIRERRWAGKTDYERFSCQEMPVTPRMNTNVHRTLLPGGPGDSAALIYDQFAVAGPLSPIAGLSSPARLTPRPGPSGVLSMSAACYKDSPDWTYQDFQKQMVKHLNITLQAQPWANPLYRSPRQYVMAKTYGMDGATGSGSPLLREEKMCAPATLRVATCQLLVPLLLRLA